MDEDNPSPPSHVDHRWGRGSRDPHPAHTVEVDGTLTHTRHGWGWSPWIPHPAPSSVDTGPPPHTNHRWRQGPRDLHPTPPTPALPQPAPTSPVLLQLQHQLRSLQLQHHLQPAGEPPLRQAAVTAGPPPQGPIPIHPTPFLCALQNASAPSWVPAGPGTRLSLARAHQGGAEGIPPRSLAPALTPRRKRPSLGSSLCGDRGVGSDGAAATTPSPPRPLPSLPAWCGGGNAGETPNGHGAGWALPPRPGGVLGARWVPGPGRVPPSTGRGEEWGGDLLFPHPTGPFPADLGAEQLRPEAPGARSLGGFGVGGTRMLGFLHQEGCRGMWRGHRHPPPRRSPAVTSQANTHVAWAPQGRGGGSPASPPPSGAAGHPAGPVASHASSVPALHGAAASCHLRRAQSHCHSSVTQHSPSVPTRHGQEIWGGEQEPGFPGSPQQLQACHWVKPPSITGPKGPGRQALEVPGRGTCSRDVAHGGTRELAAPRRSTPWAGWDGFPGVSCQLLRQPPAPSRPVQPARGPGRPGPS